MVGHLEVPTLEQTKGLPSSLSPSIIHDLLVKELGFDGLVVTDALNMKGVSDYSGNQSSSLGSFLAGADLLLIPDDLPIAFEDIRNAFVSGAITEERLAHSVKKILNAKFDAKLHKSKLVLGDSLHQDIESSDAAKLNHQLAEASLTVIQNKNQILPIQQFENTNIAYVKIGAATGDYFLDRMRHYTSIES
ncbi:MAG: hypothetical protein CM15mP83_8750 [Flavobacteriaceae bacterium]|nr:MAG: hypothetical protein CM15mP83_8750 [Flavobacteriaceae bacterium]